MFPLLLVVAFAGAEPAAVAGAGASTLPRIEQKQVCRYSTPLGSIRMTKRCRNIQLEMTVRDNDEKAARRFLDQRISNTRPAELDPD